MVESLNKKWKEFVFAATGFGPNLLMIIMGAYFTDAINPAALPEGSYQAITGACLIIPAIFPVLWMIAKAFDGIIDIPFASITDNLSTKIGKRRPTILVCMIPMMVSYFLCWTPIGGDNRLVNTIWIVCWALVFFATYTMCLITFYGSLSTVCKTDGQRMRVTGYKAFFDTIAYCLVYALVPVVVDALQMHIDKFVKVCVPLMFTIAIPLFIIKEGEKYGYPERQEQKAEKVKILDSLKVTFGNKVFRSWLIVNACSYFGLQMFLVAMNAMILGGMGFSGLGMTILNTSAFAPVPIMIYLFNKLRAKKGIRFTLSVSLLSFAVSILSFLFGSLYVCGPDNKMLQYIIGCVGGVIGSFGIASFFYAPLLIPSQIASVEVKLTGENRSAMYFAAQAVVTTIVGAIASSLVYENIKMLFISKKASGVIYASSFTDAAAKFGVLEDQVFNLGTLIVPIVVSVACIIGCIATRKMPKDYTSKEIALEFKKINPDLDISEFVDGENAKTEKGEVVGMLIGLSILSGFIFGFGWVGMLTSSVKKITGKCNRLLMWILACLVPFAGIFVNISLYNSLKTKADEAGIKLSGNKVLYVILGLIFPIVPVNFIAMAIMQKDVNKLVDLSNE